MISSYVFILLHVAIVCKGMRVETISEAADDVPDNAHCTFSLTDILTPKNGYTINSLNDVTVSDKIWGCIGTSFFYECVAENNGFKLHPDDSTLAEKVELTCVYENGEAFFGIKNADTTDKISKLPECEEIEIPTTLLPEAGAEPSESGDPDPSESGDPDPSESGEPDSSESGDPDSSGSGDPDPSESGDPDPSKSCDPDPSKSGDTNPSGNNDTDPSGQNSTESSLNNKPEDNNESGSNSTEDNGSKSTESSGSNSTDDSGSKLTDSSGSNSTEDSGSKPNESSGSNSTEDSGSKSNESSGSNSTEDSGSKPNESSGSNLTEDSESNKDSNDGSDPDTSEDSDTDFDVTAVMVNLPKGAVITSDGTIETEDGTVLAPSGSTIESDGSVVDPSGDVVIEASSDAKVPLPAGGTISEDGIVTADGEVISPVGVTVHESGSILDEDGDVIVSTLVPVDLPPGATFNEDGTISDADGTVIVPAGYTINPDGSIVDEENNVIIAANPDATSQLPSGATSTTADLISVDGTTILSAGASVDSDGNIVNDDEMIIPSVLNSSSSEAGSEDEGSEDEDNEEGGGEDDKSDSDDSGDDDEDSSDSTTTAMPVGKEVMVDIPAGATIKSDGTIVAADGTLLAPSGSSIGHDGSVIDPSGNVAIEANPDAKVPLESGAVITDEGVLTADGETISPVGVTVHESGSVINEDGDVVISTNVAVDLPPGVTFNADGSISSEDGSMLVQPGYKITPEGSIVDAEDNVIIPPNEDAETLLPAGVKGTSSGLTSYDGTPIIPVGAYVDEGGAVRNFYGDLMIPTNSEASDETTTGTEYPPIVYEDDQRYPATADFHASTLHKDFVPIVSGTEESYLSSKSLFGFDVSSLLDSDKEQCLKSEGFNSNPDWCNIPSDCTNGLSMSLWVYVNIDHYNLDDYRDLNPANHRYIFSTGGDEDGHPGVSMYMNKILLITIVSVGDKYWKSSLVAPLVDKMWNNVGLRWDATDGLEVFINNKSVSHTTYSSDSVAKPGLDPGEVMVGCHKTSTDTEYRGFINGSVDELATWLRRLTDDETKFFLGGYDNNTSNMGIGQVMQVMENLDLADPTQFKAAMDVIASKALESLAAPTTDAPIVSTEDDDYMFLPGSEDSKTSSTTKESPTASTTTTSTDMTETLRNFERVMMAMTDVKKIVPGYSPEEMCERLNLIYIVNSMVSDTTAKDWKDIETKSEAGSSKVVTRFDDWTNKMLQGAVMKNTTTNYKCSKAADNMVMQTEKTVMSELKKNPTFVVPNPKDPVLKRSKDKFDFSTNKVLIKTSMFNDPRCDNRVVSVQLTLYDDYDDSVPMTVNPNYLNERASNYIDSKVITINANVDPVRNENGILDPFQPLCEPDQNVLKNDDGLKFQLGHNTKVSTMRKLQFHFDEIETNIKVRQCVRWNEEIGSFGGWDAAGCKMIDSNPSLTLCSCDQFGTMAILAEEVETPTVFEEPTWLASVKYILYLVSCGLLGLYCLIVGISGDLKEQFHMLGMNLSIATIGGSLVMMFSDVPRIKADRHSCFIVGLLIQFFYLAVGFLMVSIAHSCFRAITKGIIKGFLKHYLLLTVGLSFLFCGITITSSLHELGTDLRCFISIEPLVKACFFIPHTMSVCASMFIAIVIFCNLHNSALRHENLIKDYGSFAFGTAILLLFFGVTWIFGFFGYMNLPYEIPFFYIAFQLCNSSMGIVIFVTIGLCSRKYLRVFKKRANEAKAKAKQQANRKSRVGSKTMNKQPDDELDNVSISAGRYGSTSSNRGLVSGR